MCKNVRNELLLKQISDAHIQMTDLKYNWCILQNLTMHTKSQRPKH